MPHRSSASRLIAGLASVLAALASLGGLTGDAAAQIPDKFTNLQVLPKEISKGELIGTMRGFASALGVRCNHCHVGPDNLQGMDFATDEKATKRTARAMLKMVGAINGTYLAGIDTGREEKLQVRCQTCHHGLAVPTPIEDVVAHEIDSAGLDAAISRYRDLRKENYGSAAYDFSQVPLNGLAERLARSQKPDEALAVIRLNIEVNPEDFYPHVVQANLLRSMGRTDEALAEMRRAAELGPEVAWIAREIEKLEAAAGTPAKE